MNGFDTGTETRPWTRPTAPMAASTLGTVLVALALAAAPAETDAQTAPPPISFEARAGVAIPAGAMADLVDVGPAFGVGAAYEVKPRVAVRLDADLALYGGAEFDAAAAEQTVGPDVNLWHVTASAEFDLTEPTAATPWRITATGGLGATVFDADRFDEGVDNPRTGEDDVREFDGTYLTLASGLKAAYRVAPRLEAYGSLQWFLAFSDEDETAVFTELSGTEVSPFSTLSSFPLTVGVRASLP